MKVLFSEDVRAYFGELILILYQKYYFSYLETAEVYVEKLVKDITLNLSAKLMKPAPPYFEKYGSDMLYASFRMNKQTQWYVF